MKYLAFTFFVSFFILYSCQKNKAKLHNGTYGGTFHAESPYVYDFGASISIQDVTEDGLQFSGSNISMNKNHVFGFVNIIGGLGSGVTIDGNWTFENGKSVLKGTYSLVKKPSMNFPAFEEKGCFQLNEI